MTWHVQETQRCALLIKRHALSPFAAPAGLSSTVQCCSLALVHCRALEAAHSLALAPSLLRELWPACDQVPEPHLPSAAASPLPSPALQAATQYRSNVLDLLPHSGRRLEAPPVQALWEQGDVLC